MIYLLGVDHQVQHARQISLAKRFASYLSDNIEKLNIKFVGEEWSEDASKISNVKTTVPQDIAFKYNVQHRFCDPNEIDRKKIGWKSKQDDRLREMFWLDKIKDKRNKEIIFICGVNHLESFSTLLNKDRFMVKILPERFDL
jgi:hypothetical protein